MFVSHINVKVLCEQTPVHKPYLGICTSHTSSEPPLVHMESCSGALKTMSGYISSAAGCAGKIAVVIQMPGLRGEADCQGSFLLKNVFSC